MKKFLKVFIVVLLVLAVIGVTCFFFFRNYKEKKETTESVIDILESESKDEFDVSLAIVNSLMDDDRLQEIIKTSLNIDKIVHNLSSYYVSSNACIKDKDIKNALSSANSSRNLLLRMLDEYEIKSTSKYFRKQEGANDLVKQSCVYLVNYANLAKAISSSLNVDRNSDARFHTYDVYLNVVISTFSETETIEKTEKIEGTGLDEEISFVKTKNLNNIDLLNEKQIIDKIYNNFKIEVNLFNKYYNSCNKTIFAKNLSENISIVDSENQDTNEKIATYYFKLIYGI